MKDLKASKTVKKTSKASAGEVKAMTKKQTASALDEDKKLKKLINELEDLQDDVDELKDLKDDVHDLKDLQGDVDELKKLHLGVDLKGLRDDVEDLKDSKQDFAEGRPKRSFVSKFLCFVLAACSVLSSGLLLCLALRLNLLPDRYFVLFALLLLAFTFVPAIMLLRDKTSSGVRFFFALLALATMALSLYASYATSVTHDFIDSLSDDGSKTKSEYVLFVRKNSPYQELADLKGLSVAFQATDFNHTEVKNALMHDLDFKYVEEGDLAHMLLGLKLDSVQAIVLPSGLIGGIEQDVTGFKEETRQIYSFSVYLPRVEQNKTSAKNVTKEPFLLYISGSDSRGGIDETARSDVNILAAVDPADYRVLLLSIPRDYYVQLHETTGVKDKLTHAGIYGIDMSRQTIEDLLDVKINHTAKVGFSTVEKVVDALGGIDIYSDMPLHLSSDCDFSLGTQHVNGKCALAFSRERYSYQTGDRHRGQNQQQVIESIMNEALKLENLTRYPEILESLNGTFKTSLSADDMTSLAKRQLDTMKPWKVEKYNLDGTGASLPTYSCGSQPLYVMIPDESTVHTAKQKLADYLAD